MLEIKNIIITTKNLKKIKIYSSLMSCIILILISLAFLLKINVVIKTDGIISNDNPCLIKIHLKEEEINDFIKDSNLKVNDEKIKYKVISINEEMILDQNNNILKAIEIKIASPKKYCLVNNVVKIQKVVKQETIIKVLIKNIKEGV